MGPRAAGWCAVGRRLSTKAQWNATSTFPLSRTRRWFIHTEIVVGVEEEERVHERDVHVCVTVEGNTNDDGSSNGHTTLRKVRTFREVDGHRFVRWAEMIGRAVAA